ncbi:MAG TPA: glycosyltransferase family 2 protein [Candidatus Treponema faecavium]|nr:glycosyltransferase family 2 protein [Candidatus Treponema faecavium]
MHISVIIVSYNTKTLLKQCIDSIIAQTHDISYEIIVSDNGSTDGSIEMLTQYTFPVRVIENNRNIGFGAANNRALDIAQGAYILYLNSDTILLNNALKIFYDYWQTAPNVQCIGALGTNLLDTNGNITHSYGRFPTMLQELNIRAHAVYGTYKLQLLAWLFRKKAIACVRDIPKEKYIGPVDFITGANIFIKNTPAARFDERYFMYCEDVDLAYQLYKQGLQCIVIDEPQIIHLEGQSSGHTKTNEIDKYGTFSSIQNAISKIIFFKKNNESAILIICLKLLTSLLWCHPRLFAKTKKYLKQLWTI